MKTFIKRSALAAALLTLFQPLGAREASKLELTGWLVVWDNGDSWKSFEKNVKLLSRVSPQWYSCGADGMPVKAQGVSQAYQRKTLELAHANGVKVLALTSNSINGDFDPVRVERFLVNPAVMRRHAEKLAGMAKAEGADGIDLDYELLKAKDRNPYSKFVEMLSEECRKRGLLLAIALHPKTEEPGNWDGAQAQDWKRLGAAVDFFRPMCYDNHWASSDAGPLAPLDWTEKVLALALKLVPADKIELGIPGYGYDWKGKNGAGLSWKEYAELAKKKGPARRDTATGELTFKYEGREVWFVDSKALISKIVLAKKKHLRGLGLWRLGSEDPGFWKMFKNNR